MYYVYRQNAFWCAANSLPKAYYFTGARHRLDLIVILCHLHTSKCASSRLVFKCGHVALLWCNGVVALVTYC